MRQIALVIDYLVWMPLATGVSLFVMIFAYGFAVEVIEPFPHDAAVMLTSLLLVGWPIWILRLAWNIGNETAPAVRLLAGAIFAVPTTLLLALVLNLVNACNAGGGFPFGGDSCPIS